MTNCSTDKKIYKKLILIDLDGVLNNYHGKYNSAQIPKIKTGARNFLKILYQDYKINIFTARNKEDVKKWLIENNLVCFIQEITNIKSPQASIILDDRAINFNGDFELAYNAIKDFKPHWKQD